MGAAEGEMFVEGADWKVRVPRLPKLPPMRASAGLRDTTPNIIVSANNVNASQP
jgi:hypothetical protein